MLEHCVRALLADPNLPEQAVATAVSGILDTYKRESSRVSIVEHSWAQLASHAIQWAMCVGPPAFSTKRHLRVTRIVSLKTYLNFYLDYGKAASLGVALPEHGASHDLSFGGQIFSPNMFRRHSVMSHPRRPVWTTLTADSKHLTPDELRDELGMIHFRAGDSLVAIDYDLPATTLRAPTVLDAGMQPWFVPKPVGQAPRAWNWRESRWGLAECVHPPTAHFTRPAVRFLGQLQTNAPENLNQSERVLLTPGRHIEAFLEGVLKQVTAHVDLLPFISGAKLVLDLSPTEFERFTATLYTRAGYVTTLTRASADGGIDVIAISNADARDGLLIQVKRYNSGTVGIAVVRELIGARHLAGSSFKRFRLAVVTTGKFSRVARAAEESNAAEIELHDYNSLISTLVSLGTTRLSDIYFSQVTAATGAPQR